MSRSATTGPPLVVQEMAPPGVDVHIHCSTDRVLGPVVTVGLGSLQTTADVDGVEPPRTGVVGVGADDGRDAHASDVRSPTQGSTTRRWSMRSSASRQLMADQHDLTEIDINPLIVSADACLVTDARVAVSHDEHSELPLRRLV